ncbi:MAG: hypothetical protein WA254_09640 [Candidatus Sulfotelmatobacter sp.]
MEKLRLALFSLSLVLAASLALSCGTSSKNTTGQLQSITITPATAAAGLPGQQVQFIATGHYNTAPYIVTPQPATWGACYQNAPTTAVSVTSTGLAQCEAPSGPITEYSLFAFDQTNCNVITACGGGCTIVGTAQLSCSGNQVVATVRRTAPSPHLPGEQN